jgi:hypothetical protein
MTNTAEQKTLRQLIEERLTDEKYNQEQVRTYAVYCQGLLNAKNKQGQPQNPWMSRMHPDRLASEFKAIAAEGLVFDGKHITWQSTGVSFDYVAYKNKMLVVYPDSKIDLQVVYQDDTFSVSKESGRVEYSHTIADPFGNDESKIKGAYCIIKNIRGEFITTLSLAEIQKHRSVAKTDYIWAAWFKEMTLKTVIKKAVKYHFDDIYVNIEQRDNEQYDPGKVVTNDKPTDEQIEQTLADLDGCKTLDEARKFHIGLSPAIRNDDRVLEVVEGLSEKFKQDENENS